MKPKVILVIILLSSLTSGCRQPDGATPTPDEEAANRIFDIGNGLQQVARGEAGAKEGLVQDFQVFVDPHTQAAQSAAQGFATRLGDAVLSASLTEQSAQQLAHTIWVVAAATELSEKQTRALQDELRSQLTLAGISQDKVDAVVAEVPTVQRAVTTRPRRWYEVL